MLVLAAAPPHTFYLPISLNSLDREGVRLMSPRDSHITSKTSCRCWWYRASDATGFRRSSMKISFIVLFSFQLIGSGAHLGRSEIFALGVVFFYFGFVVGPCLYLIDVMLYSCIVWSGDCKPTLYLFLIQYMGCVKITPLATLPTMRLCL